MFGGADIEPLDTPPPDDEPVRPAGVNTSGSTGPDTTEAPAEHVPDERARAIVDAVASIVQDTVDRLGLLRVEAVDLGRLARAADGRLAVDLSARPLGLVDDDRSEARARQHIGAANAGRSRADDDDDRLSQGGLRR